MLLKLEKIVTTKLGCWGTARFCLEQEGEANFWSEGIYDDEGILLVVLDYSEGQGFVECGWLIHIRQYTELYAGESSGEEGWPGSPVLLVRSQVNRDIRHAIRRDGKIHGCGFGSISKSSDSCVV